VVVHSTPSVAFTFQILSIVDVAGNLLRHPASAVFPVVFPASLVGGAIQVNHFTLAFSYKTSVLAKVYIAVGIHQLANAIARSIRKKTFVNYAVNHQKAALTMQLVIQKLTLVNAAVCHFHFSFEAFVVFPFTHKLASIYPANLTEALSFTSIPVALVGGFFELGAILTGQTVVVLHRAVTARPAIFEIASELISVLKVDNTKTKWYR